MELEVQFLAPANSFPYFKNASLGGMYLMSLSKNAGTFSAPNTHWGRHSERAESAARPTLGAGAPDLVQVSASP
jgi:hypothetical protein